LPVWSLRSCAGAATVCITVADSPKDPIISQQANVYRPDIDGLRAIAVAAVLAFHAFPNSFPGGFTGVDVFFVISGFLISGIILHELRAGSFTFAQFYARRIRRIFPALALVLAGCLAFGWWALTPYDYDQLGAHVAAGAGFVSNILLWRESGYWDTDSALKPLLHLWSLGVEEQYYLVWPVLLFVLRRHMERIFWLILGIAAASFALNIVLVGRLPEAAFYLPATRFWELMLGSIVAYLHSRRAKPPDVPLAWLNLAALAGTGLLILAFVLVRDGRGFPGWWALFPTLGSLLLILSGPQAWINRRILANRVVVYIGLISYPLYLWHWPILSFARILNGGLPPVSIRIGALVASVLLACATFEWVEKPIRRMGRGAAAPRAAGLSAACVGALAVYGLLVLGNFAQARSDSVPHLAEISAAYSDWHFPGNGTIRGDTQQAVLFFGDSHMQQFLPRIETLMHEKHAPRRTVIFRTRGGCAPVPGIERTGYGCERFVAETFALARRPEVKTIIISASWAGFTVRTDYYKAGDEDGKPLKMLTPQTEWVLAGFEAAVTQLVAAGKEVVIVLSSPFGDQFDPREMARRDGLGFHVVLPPAVPRSAMTSERAFIDDRLIEIARRAHASVLDPLDTLCTASVCPVLDSAGKPLLKDNSHLRSSFVSAHFDAFDHYVLIDPPAAPHTAAAGLR
jgi:peptidoglycan/LPS O-acetylase OafA/YrhL